MTIVSLAMQQSLYDVSSHSVRKQGKKFFNSTVQQWGPLGMDAFSALVICVN